MVVFIGFKTCIRSNSCCNFH